MNAVFADTFYWIALADYTDHAHARALALTSELSTRHIVTTDEVLTEYMNFFSDSIEPSGRQVAQSVQSILVSSSIRVIPQSRPSFLAGRDLYAARADKGYSLTDCISMQAMRLEGVTDVLTNDNHFEQEGFRALFRK